MQTLIDPLIAKTITILKIIKSAIPKAISSAGKNKSRYHTVATFLLLSRKRVIRYNINKTKYVSGGNEYEKHG